MEAVSWPHESLKDSHQDGCTEPWIAEIVAALLKARQPKLVVELGGFVGTTSAWLALALKQIGGGELWISEPDHDRREAIEKRIDGIQASGCIITLVKTPSPQVIATFEDRSIDFAWVDNDHQKHHVEQEIVNLWPKMSPGGIMCFHDVWGVCDLQSVVRKYGGIALDLPRLGPAGGLGIIQVPNA
jgi:predicted O-methyltransferase YrrM